MSIVQHNEKETVDGVKQVEAVLLRAATNEKGETISEIAPYSETEEEKAVSALILKHFVLGTTNQYTPRVEFNDLSLTLRDQYDAMSFNTYQPNNGEAWGGSPQTAWRSRALRPIVRNKCMSIAAHATARLIFPKVFAFNEESDEQSDAARLIEDLMEWSGDVSNYSHIALMRVITAMYSPASIGYTEYGEVMRRVKTERDGETGKWLETMIRDEAYPCFMDQVVPVTQLYIENVYEPDIQKQGFLIWRKVYSYSQAQAKYGDAPNFKYVRPGVQTIYDDANRTFYYVYDSNMRSEDVEEVTYWNKNLDLKVVKVNNIFITEYDAPNPRADKLYPFDKFVYEPINDHFFYGKSLAFKLQQDASVINTLYQMVIDGTYLSIFKPMVAVGGEIIASDVIVPGAVTTFQDPTSDLRAINVGSDLKSGLETLSVVEKSIDESSVEPQQQGAANGGTQTAYEISKLEQNANTVLGLFLQMIAQHVKDFGKLRLGDILQYLTLPQVAEISGDSELTYKTFFLKGKDNQNNKKIEFDSELPDTYETKDEYLDASWDLLAEESDKKMTILKANPIEIAKLKYMITINPDVLNPRSKDLERAYNLETYDRMVNNPKADPEQTLRLLLDTNELTQKDPDKYVAQEQQQQDQATPDGMLPSGSPAPKKPMVSSGNSPLAAVAGKTAPTPGGGAMVLAGK